MASSTIDARLEGIVASAGIAHGTAFIYRNHELAVPNRPITDTAAEADRLRRAATSAVRELAALKERIRGRLGDEFGQIFRSQQTIAEDESVLDEVVERIDSDHVCAERALQRVFDQYCALFAELSDEDYNKARVTDIEDVYRRILRNLLGLPEVSLDNIDDRSIIVAEELLPSDTATMDASRVVGMVTERGGSTSHVAILAKSLGIPAAVRVTGALARIATRDRIVIDTVGDDATVFVNPGERTRADLEAKAARETVRRAAFDRYRGQPPITPDGHHVVLSANVGSTSEIDSVRAAGATSVGLYRSEFLFLNSATLPNEEQQYQAYRAVAEAFASRFVIIRTLDVGGDKRIPSIPMEPEVNPFLGNRAIRLCLARPDLFRTQLRAILRAGVHGRVRMIFPMIGGTTELDRALELLDEAKRSLESDGHAYDRDLEVGVMIEIPSAVWVADALAQRVSFFSIGTNDLTQYLLAADRMNGVVQSYYRSYDPAVFRSIGAVVQAATRHGCSVGLCGELGGERLAIPALVGLGVTELSMNPRALPEATWTIRTTPIETARALAARVLDQENDEQIRAILQNYHETKER